MFGRHMFQICLLLNRIDLGEMVERCAKLTIYEANFTYV